MTIFGTRLSLPALGMLMLLSGCASDAGTGGDAPLARNTGLRPIEVCRTGDTEISSETQCLQDDGACYQISNGNWCTGERGNVCPVGSYAVNADHACPSARCFQFSESLRCAIQ